MNPETKIFTYHSAHYPVLVKCNNLGKQASFHIVDGVESVYVGGEED